jgi:hypothetical protein
VEQTWEEVCKELKMMLKQNSGYRNDLFFLASLNEPNTSENYRERQRKGIMKLNRERVEQIIFSYSPSSKCQLLR